MNRSDAIQSLEALHRGARARTSRTLHDEIGPSLCSAGLMVGLLRNEVGNLPPDGREWLDTLQAALESAMESARLLSYRTDPALAERCGLEAALEYLVRGTSLSLNCAAGMPDWTVAQREAACRIVRDVIPAIPGEAGRLETSGAGLTLHGNGPLNLDPSAKEVLRLVARLERLEIMYEVPMGAVLFSLGLLKAT